ncbi:MULTISPECIES: ABC transporter permease [unclassified Methanoculleus]|uniref:ABC transporter permease n=1 Tax=unclassified Methanoculleus TaxID=2619537 RepID=UPI0025D45800|nr:MULTISPECIES: ABC transporter permease [unclassified Methanoculleus]MCK9317599.1 ABC transporter permease [Methanoculleus sp.]MDD2254112.1 ABC transporter permease [Methanoculleus sp.]MDD2787303.1 ABC transporter permease [Methanoculleus sp.]MDD3215875.1 ABC transporter permease [Methanoculleus sp.]MDD4314216.1 ABC transporter permease [Methanoculleus sp.]
MKTRVISGDLLRGGREASLTRWKKHRGRYVDWCIVGFCIMGAALVGITVLALASMATAELGNPAHLLEVALSSEVIHSILLTFAAGANAVLLLALFGTPLAYVLARAHPSRFKGVVESIVDIPLILPHTVAGLLVYLLFMRRGWLGAPLSGIGLAFEDAYPGTVVAMLFVASPFYVNTMREGFEKVPVHLENVARTLGAGTFTTFRTVTLPLSLRHMYNGAIFAWGRAIGEFAGVIMIAYYPFIISTLIYYSFTTDGIQTSRSIAFTVILVSLGVFYLLRRMTRCLGRHDDRV